MLVIVAGDSVGCQGHFGSNLGQCVMNLRPREFSALRASVSVPRVLFNMLEIWPMCLFGVLDSVLSVLTSIQVYSGQCIGTHKISGISTSCL